MLDFYSMLKNGAEPDSVIQRTPVRIVNMWVNSNRVLAKCESEQPIGSFKIRGAYNAVRLADPERAAFGIVAASAGNHAQGVALASRQFGYNSTIFMPECTPLTKQLATLKYGADVRLVDGDFDDTNALAKDIARQNGSVLVPPFDHPDVIAGQATSVLEALEQAPETEIVYVPVGGGGYLAGAIIAARYWQQFAGCKLQKIIGVEASELPSMQTALESKGVLKLPPASTIAEGIAVRQAGGLPYSIISRAYKEGLVEMVSVSEAEIAHAMYEQMHALESPMPEGAGAAALAGALKHTYQNGIGQRNILIMESGRNIDEEKINQIESEQLALRTPQETRAFGSRAVLNVLKGY
jgi:threonine dehydratase